MIEPLSQPVSRPASPETQPPSSRTESSPHPEINPANALTGGRETSKNVLYVGGLDRSVSEEILQELMGANGAISSIKLLSDKNRPGYNYAFVEFREDAQADASLHAFNGRQLHESVLRINFAFQSSTFSTSQNAEEQLHNIFVGDLSPDVDDEALYKFFSHFQSLKQAHVMWDMQTSRSRGYGFATFRDATGAELALQSMNGKLLRGRVIRCNWAYHNPASNGRQNDVRPHSQKQYRHQRQLQLQQQHPHPQQHPHIQQLPYPQQQQYPRYQNGGSRIQRNNRSFPSEPAPYPPPSQDSPQQNCVASGGPLMTPQPYDVILRLAPSWQMTVYLGNIAHFTQENDLIPVLQNFGFIVDFKFHPERGCAFVTFDSHERAALVISQLAGFNVNGRPLKCGWAKPRAPVNNVYPPNFTRNILPVFDGRQ